MVKSLDKVIQEAIQKADSKDESRITAAANAILTEDIKVGDTVSTVSDIDVHPLQGVAGRVVSLDQSTGYAEVEFPNGMKLRQMTSLLMHV